MNTRFDAEDLFARARDALTRAGEQAAEVDAASEDPVMAWDRILESRWLPELDIVVTRLESALLRGAHRDEVKRLAEQTRELLQMITERAYRAHLGDDPAEALRVLTSELGSDNAVAELAGVRSGDLAAWRRDGTPAAARSRLATSARIVLELRPAFTVDETLRWFTMGRGWLGGDSPLVVLGSGDGKRLADLERRARAPHHLVAG